MDDKEAKRSADDVAGKAKETASAIWDSGRDNVKGMAQQAADTKNQAYGAAKAMTSEALEAGQARYDDSVRALGRQISATPISSLVMAGMFGAVVGWACRATMDHSDQRTRR